MRPSPSVTAVLLAALAVPLTVAAPAAAATTLVAVEPANGAVLAGPPALVRLTFSGPPAGTVEVTLDGRPLPADVDGPVVTASLPPAAGTPGRHVVGYALTGADGEPLRGETGWTVDPAGAGGAAGSGAPGDRLVSAAVLLLLGGTVLVVVRRLRARR